uniref:Uncharacterized protein n=1 Tax=viral metagenome TaxID=1070528 RepID=A0A6C0L3K1_9ZZZZ|tara:strand:+ start:2655 stop:4580 length:1926 start_codon:yes stop_codon:yes gene_type:complete
MVKRIPRKRPRGKTQKRRVDKRRTQKRRIDKRRTQKRRVDKRRIDKRHVDKRRTQKRRRSKRGGGRWDKLKNLLTRATTRGMGQSGYRGSVAGIGALSRPGTKIPPRNLLQPLPPLPPATAPSWNQVMPRSGSVAPVPIAPVPVATAPRRTDVLKTLIAEETDDQIREQYLGEYKRLKHADIVEKMKTRIDEKITEDANRELAYGAIPLEQGTDENTSDIFDNMVLPEYNEQVEEKRENEDEGKTEIIKARLKELDRQINKNTKLLKGMKEKEWFKELQTYIQEGQSYQEAQRGQRGLPIRSYLIYAYKLTELYGRGNPPLYELPPGLDEELYDLPIHVRFPIDRGLMEGYFYSKDIQLFPKEEVDIDSDPRLRPKRVINTVLPSLGKEYSCGKGKGPVERSTIRLKELLKYVKKIHKTPNRLALRLPPLDAYGREISRYAGIRWEPVGNWGVAWSALGGGARTGHETTPWSASDMERTYVQKLKELEGSPHSGWRDPSLSDHEIEGDKLNKIKCFLQKYRILFTRQTEIELYLRALDSGRLKGTAYASQTPTMEKNEKEYLGKWEELQKTFYLLDKDLREKEKLRKDICLPSCFGGDNHHKNCPLYKGKEKVERHVCGPSCFGGINHHKTCPLYKDYKNA